jgi:hypothetical protein
MSLWACHMGLLPALFFFIPSPFCCPFFFSWTSPLVSRVKSPCITCITTRDRKRQPDKQTERNKKDSFFSMACTCYAHPPPHTQRQHHTGTQ